MQVPGFAILANVFSWYCYLQFKKEYMTHNIGGLGSKIKLSSPGLDKKIYDSCCNAPSQRCDFHAVKKHENGGKLKSLI